MVILVDGRAGAAEHDDIRHEYEGDREVVIEASDIFAAVVAIDVVGIFKMLVEARNDEVSADIDEAYQHEEPDQKPFIAVGGEVLEDFLPGRETGAYEERDKRPCELHHIKPANFVPTHKTARPFLDGCEISNICTIS
ncbi:hypothetical protein SDC9_122818 [bioreactor metagenome]|uniref:Uncharacterized protein n=1 Tax=bioreactor metagenome TaxID=1076179 RepID=A0A645CFV2_9ZZZZ